jgi:hypothetical protein
MDNERYQQEVMLAWGAVLAGLMFAFMIWAGRDLQNFIYTWGAQGVALAIMFFVRARPAAIAGAALAFAGYLAYFKWYVAHHPSDGLVWLLYLFSLPGGAIGAIAAAILLKKHDERPVSKAVLAAGALVAGGIAINQWLLQSKLI